MALSGCLSELSVPFEIARRGGELARLFDQAEIAQEVPDIIHTQLGTEEVLFIERHTLHPCIGSRLLQHVMKHAAIEVSNEELECNGYMGWAHRGNLMHL